MSPAASTLIAAAAPALFPPVPARRWFFQWLYPLIMLIPLGATSAEIYRCTLVDGSVVFQDQKCASGESRVLRSSNRSGTISNRELRRWLDQSPRPKPSRSSTTATTRSPVTERRINPGVAAGLPPRPRSEYALAVCSEQFLICTGDGLQQLDRCISGIPTCSALRGSNCCAASLVRRYELIRSAGVSQREAVRAALLGTADD